MPPILAPIAFPSETSILVINAAWRFSCSVQSRVSRSKGSPNLSVYVGSRSMQFWRYARCPASATISPDLLTYAFRGDPQSELGVYLPDQGRSDYRDRSQCQQPQPASLFTLSVASSFHCKILPASKPQ